MYTEEEVHRALGRLRIETCQNDMELVERMYDVVNKAEYAVPDKRQQYETQAAQAATLNLKQPTHKLGFLSTVSACLLVLLAFGCLRCMQLAL